MTFWRSGVGPDLAQSEHGPCFVGDTVTLDEFSFTIKVEYISRATFDSERHWTLLDLEAGSIVWAPKRFRGCFGELKSEYPPATRHGSALAKWGPTKHGSSGSLDSCTLEYRKGSANGNVDSLIRSPESATEHDRSGLTSFKPVGLTSPNPVGDSDIYLLRTCGLCTLSSPIPGVGLSGLVPRAEGTGLSGLVSRIESNAWIGSCPAPLAKSTALGGLVPRTEHDVLGGFPLTYTDFHNFRTHEPLIRIDGLSARQGKFVARISASVATAEGCTSSGSI